MENSPNFFAKLKFECVAQYHQTGSITRVQRSYCSMSAKTYLFRTLFSDGLKTLTNIEWLKMHKHPKDLKCCLSKTESLL